MYAAVRAWSSLTSRRISSITAAILSNTFNMFTFLFVYYILYYPRSPVKLASLQACGLTLGANPGGPTQKKRANFYNPRFYNLGLLTS